ncbi:MAG: hypothetical protein LBS19_12195 [Clostridiales bacterium]|jgi:hypothetical protein|nr:hypothetical protein [Clostridiales bacterium]
MNSKIKKLVAYAAALITVFMTASGVYGATEISQLDKAYWPWQERFNAALEAGDHAGIIASGEEITALFLVGGDPAVKAAEWKAGGDLELNILRTVTQSVAEAYEALGDFAGARAAYELTLPVAVAWQEANAPADTEFVKTIYQNKIAAYGASMTLYAQIPGAGGDVSCHGAKHEPAAGIIYGEVHAGDEAKRVNSAKTPSASLVYVLYETEIISDFDWIIRPLTQTRDIVEIAWNVLYEGDTLPAVTNGRAKIEAAADYLNGLGTPIWLRFGAEMNVWQKKADPAQFIAAFRFVSSIMKERAPNVAMLWSPGATGHIETTYAQFYPGDEYVDWVGVSLYTVKYFQGNKNLDGTAQVLYMTGGFANPVKKLEGIVAQYGDRKPIMLSECGVENYSVTNGEDVTEWAKPQLRAVYQTIPMVYSQVKAILYFNTAVEGLDEAYRYTLYDNPAMETLYAASVANPYFLPAGTASAPVTYKKLVSGAGKAQLPQNSVALAIYAPFVQKDVTVTYMLDGQWIGSSPAAPYRQIFDFSGYADGEHLLTVTAAAGGVTLDSGEYSVNIAGGVCTVEKR